MRYVVIGAGAIGGTVGAYMVQAGYDVLFVDTDREHVRVMNERGLTVRTFEGEFTVPVKAILPEELEGPLEAVLLAVKAPATAGALRAVQPKLAPDGFVVSLQNGLNEILISEAIGAERTVGCFINFSADYLEPGLVHYGGPGAYFIGELNGERTARIEELQRAFASWGNVQITDNIFGYLWGKMGYGAMLFATSLTNESMGDCIDQNRPLMVAIAREALSVAGRLGVKPVGFDGYEPDVYLTEDWPAIHRSLDGLVAVRHRDQKKHAGIWRDLVVRKRKTEVDFQPGAVVAEGEKLGLAMPLLSAIVRMIHEIEDGKREVASENLDVLRSLLV